MRPGLGFQEESKNQEVRINSSATITSTPLSDERVSSFLKKVYGWMFLGLGITAVTAYAAASSPIVIETLVSNRLLIWILLLGELGLVFYLSFRINSLAPVTAGGLFMLYSALTGVTTSLILVVYTGASVAMTFVVAAGMFGAMAVFGTLTKRSLAGAGQFFFMGLIGLILASVVGLFWQNDALQFVISVVGVIVFTGLTAWDAQRLKQMALVVSGEREGAIAIVGALSLYLDFINLFFFLLRFTGDRRH